MAIMMFQGVKERVEKFEDAVEWFGDVSVSKTNDNAAVPSLKSKITKILKASPELPWDAAVRRIASKCFEADDE